MTDTAPATAIGLPTAFDRRSFLATLAAAGVMTAGAAAPAIAADHPDAELLEMEAQWRAAEARREAFDIAADSALNNLISAEIPKDLYWRRSDFMTICIDRTRDCARYGSGEDARYVYDANDSIQRLRKDLGRLSALPSEQRLHGSDRDMARMREIVEASEVHAARNKAVEDACGLTEPSAASDRESLLIMDLLDSIIRTPARTAEGVAAKARAASSGYADPDKLEAELLTELLATYKGGTAWDARRRLLSISLIVDAMKLGAATPASSERSAA